MNNPNPQAMDSHDPLSQQRQLIRPLLAPSAPEDALTAYYALWHDPRRTALTLHRTPGGHIDGFVAVCQTGQDLFVPLVVLRAPPQAVGELLGQALKPGRPYRLIVPPSMHQAIEAVMQIEQAQVNIIYKLGNGQPIGEINVLAEPGQGPFQFEVRDEQQTYAAAGINWRTDRLAEMYVYVVPEFQSEGWGYAVGRATVDALLAARLLPLYTTAEGNERSRRLAYRLGFVDSGAREFEMVGSLRE